MKKSILFLALAAVALTSCNNLKENEYEITGEIDKSLDGKKVILQKLGGQFGFVPIDTVVIKGGEFVFKDTIKSAPEMYFLSIDGIQGNANFIAEPGSIELKIDKDTLAKSVSGGTYNNEKLEEFKAISKQTFTQEQKFTKLNTPKLKEAQAKNDTVTINSLRKQYKAMLDSSGEKYVAFIKENPKAYYNLYVLEQVARIKSMDEVKKLFNGLDASVKNTKYGKQISKFFVDQDNQMKAAEAAKSAPQAAGVKIGDAAPDFVAPGVDGKPVSLKQSMGKVTIVDFWASWCGPCRKENPNMVALYNEFHAKGLNMIGVSLDKEGDGAKWKEAIAKDKLGWVQVSNLKFWEDPIARQYGVTGIPATFILDANGKVVARDLRGDALKAKVAELLK